MRILLAVDGSVCSTQARDLVANLAWPAGVSVTLLMTYLPPATWFADPTLSVGGWVEEAEELLRRHAEEELAALAEPLERRGLAVDRRVIRGRPADTILAVADEIGARLIVVGSRGRGQIATMLLGSVSAEVADRARRPVLVVRGADAERVLVATDGAPCSDHIPDVLAELGALAGLPTIALSVTPVDGPAFTLLVQLYTMGSLDLEPERERLQAMHESYAESMAARLSAAGLPATAMVRSGEPAEEITKAAAESGADIIVTGSRCLEGLDRVLLGSVARNVLLHADASVLIVPAAGSAAGQAAETEATV